MPQKFIIIIIIITSLLTLFTSINSSTPMPNLCHSHELIEDFEV